MKRTIRLAEGDLHEIVMEAIGDVLGQPLDGNCNNEILSLAKSAENSLMSLNQKAVECNMWELARDSAKLVEMIQHIVGRINASMR